MFHGHSVQRSGFGDFFDLDQIRNSSTRAIVNGVTLKSRDPKIKMLLASQERAMSNHFTERALALRWAINASICVTYTRSSRQLTKTEP